MDSTIVTPVKQRRLINNHGADTIKKANTTENISLHSLITANTSTGFKTSMMVRYVVLL